MPFEDRTAPSVTAPEAVDIASILGSQDATTLAKCSACGTRPATRDEICEQCKGKLRGWGLFVVGKTKDGKPKHEARLRRLVGRFERDRPERSIDDTADRWLERHDHEYRPGNRRWWRGPLCHYKPGESAPDWMAVTAASGQRASTRPDRFVGPSAEDGKLGPPWVFFRERGPEVLKLTNAQHRLLARLLPLLTGVTRDQEYDLFLDAPVNEGRSISASLLASGGFGILQTSKRPKPRPKPLDDSAVIREVVRQRLKPQWPLEELGAATQGAGRPCAARRAQRSELARIVTSIPIESVTTKALAIALHTSDQSIRSIRRQAVIQRGGPVRGEEENMSNDQVKMLGLLRDDIKALHADVTSLKERFPDSTETTAAVNAFIESCLGSD